MSSKTHEPTAVITEWKIGARGSNAIVAAEASFVIVDLDVAGVLKAAEAAIHGGLKEEKLSGTIVTLELRIEFERRKDQTQTTVSGFVRLGEATQERRT